MGHVGNLCYLCIGTSVRRLKKHPPPPGDGDSGLGPLGAYSIGTSARAASVRGTTDAPGRAKWKGTGASGRSDTTRDRGLAVFLHAGPRALYPAGAATVEAARPRARWVLVVTLQGGGNGLTGFYHAPRASEIGGGFDSASPCGQTAGRSHSGHVGMQRYYRAGTEKTFSFAVSPAW